MNSVQKLVLSLTLVVISSLAQANDVKGFYFGSGITSSAFTDGGYSDYLSNTRLKDTRSAGTKFYAGYMFNKTVGIEGSFTNAGKFTYLNTRTGKETELKPTITSISANLGHTFSNGLRPFANAGLSSLNVHQSGTKLYENDSAAAFHFGFGGQWEPSNLHGLGFRIGIDEDMFFVKQQYVYGSSTYQGTTYTNVISNAYAGIQYRF